MSEENKALIKRWFEQVWNNNNRSAIDEMFSADGVAYGLGEGELVRGPADFKVFHAAFRDAFPDIRIEVLDMVAEGDKVAARCSVKGRHSGDTLGFKATNQGINIEGIVLVTIKNGQIVDAWNHFDFMNMHRQLGRTLGPAV